MFLAYGTVSPRWFRMNEDLNRTVLSLNSERGKNIFAAEHAAQKGTGAASLISSAA